MPESPDNDQVEMPPETAPTNLPVTARGFSSSEQAQQVAYAVGAAARIISRLIDLERIDGITVAVDYTDALAAVDRGFPNAKAPTVTTGDEIVGVAMSVNVLRDEVVKAHLVFNAAAMAPLLDSNDPNFPMALSLIAHECGHVADLKRRDTKFPGTILQSPYQGSYQQMIFPIADVLWEEYAACRASAMFCEKETPRFEESLVTVMSVARPRAAAAVQAFAAHGDVRLVLSEAGNALCDPLRMVAYLCGHLDGLAQELDQAPAARDVIASCGYATLADQLTFVLRDPWTRKEDWASLDEFEPLRQVCLATFASGGLYLHPGRRRRLHADIRSACWVRPISESLTRIAFATLRADLRCRWAFHVPSVGCKAA